MTNGAIKCFGIADGMRFEEKVAILCDAHDDLDYVSVDADFLTRSNGDYLLPVYVLGQNETGDLALIELPQESERGNNRLWVSAGAVPSLAGG